MAAETTSVPKLPILGEEGDFFEWRIKVRAHVKEKSRLAFEILEGGSDKQEHQSNAQGDHTKGRRGHLDRRGG